MYAVTYARVRECSLVFFMYIMQNHELVPCSLCRRLSDTIAMGWPVGARLTRVLLSAAITATFFVRSVTALFHCAGMCHMLDVLMRKFELCRAIDVISK